MGISIKSLARYLEFIPSSSESAGNYFNHVIKSDASDTKLLPYDAEIPFLDMHIQYLKNDELYTSLNGNIAELFPSEYIHNFMSTSMPIADSQLRSKTDQEITYSDYSSASDSNDSECESKEAPSVGLTSPLNALEIESSDSSGVFAQIREKSAVRLRKFDREKTDKRKPDLKTKEIQTPVPKRPRLSLAEKYQKHKKKIFTGPEIYEILRKTNPKKAPNIRLAKRYEITKITVLKPGTVVPKRDENSNFRSKLRSPLKNDIWSQK